MAGVLWAPGSQLLIHDIVGTEHLQSAVRLNATSRQMGVLFGPAIGGALILVTGPPAGLFVNALIYLPLTIWLLTVLTPATRGRAPRRHGARQLARRDRHVTSSLLDPADHHHGSPRRVCIVLRRQRLPAQMPEFAHDLGTEQADFAYSALLSQRGGRRRRRIYLKGKGGFDRGSKQQLSVPSSGHGLPRLRFRIITAYRWRFCSPAFSTSPSTPWLKRLYNCSRRVISAAGSLDCFRWQVWDCAHLAV